MSTDTTGSATSSDLSDQVIEEILGLMGRRRINKAEMARRLTVKEDWIGRRLNGRQEIGLNDLQRIAVVLGVSASDLLPKREATAGYPRRDPLAPKVIATVGDMSDRANHRRPHRSRSTHDKDVVRSRPATRVSR